MFVQKRVSFKETYPGFYDPAPGGVVGTCPGCPLALLACHLPAALLQPFLALLPLPAPLRQGGTACKCTSGLELLACPPDAQCYPAHHTEALPPCSRDITAELSALGSGLSPLSAGADESYELNAERELEEEMGVAKAQLQHCFDFYHADKVSRLWGRLFTCTYNGPMNLDPEEVESGQFMSWAEVRQLLQTQQVTPDSKACVEQYLQQHAK